jgi:Flp pilus assembly protein TadD
MRFARLAKRAATLCAALIIAAVAVVSVPILAQTKAGQDASAAKLSAAKSAAPFTIELYSTKVRFENDGTGERQSDVRIRIESDAGAQSLRTLAFHYNAAHETFALAYLRVKKADGSTVEAIPDAVKDAPGAVAKDASAFTDLHDVQISTPALAPGDTVNYGVITKIVKPVASGEFWYSHNFLSNPKAADEELRIDVPADRTVHAHWLPQFVPSIAMEGTRKIYSWKLSSAGNSAAAAPKEAAQLPNNASVDITFTSFANWPEVGKWFAATASRAATASPEITDKTQSLTASTKTDLEKMEALYDFVAKQIRLVRVAPEVAQFRVRDAVKVLTEGYGDQLDKCALLVAMLGASGLHADFALMSSKGTLDADLPAPDLITNVILGVASGKETVWMDPSEAAMPFRLLTPNLRSKQALIASAAEPPYFAETPADPPFPSKQRVVITGRVSSLGQLSARIQYTLRGDNEFALRMAFLTAPKEQWKQVAQTMATLDGLRGEVVAVNPSDPTATHDPFVLQFELADPEFLDWSQKQLLLALPLPTFGLPDAPADSAKPIALGSPLDVASKLTLTLPVTDTAKAPAGSAVDRDYAEYHSKYEAQDNVVTSERSLRFLKHEVPAARAEDYAAFAHAVEADESQEIAVTNIIPDIPADASAKELIAAGAAALKNQKYSNALRLLRRAQELNPKQPGLWNELGLAQLQLGQFGDAAASFRKQLEANPADESANSLLGLSLLDQKQYDEAAAAFEKQIALKPLDASAHTYLGAVYIEQKKFQAAASELEKASALSPDDAGVRVRLGQAYLGMGKTETALTAFEKAAALSPSAAVENEIAFSLAEHNVALGRAEHFAISAMETTEAQLRNLSLKRVTVEQVQAAASLAPIWDTLGWVYFSQGKYDKAASFIEPAWLLEERGDEGDHLGQIYEKRGAKNLAIHTYTLALAAGGGPAGTRERLAKLVGSGNVSAARMNQAKAELLRMHTIPLGKSAGGGKASFVVLLESTPAGPIAGEAKFLAGDSSLGSMTDRLRTLKFPKIFPEGSTAEIVLRGDVACSAKTLTCQFTYQAPAQLLARK